MRSVVVRSLIYFYIVGYNVVFSVNFCWRLKIVIPENVLIFGMMLNKICTSNIFSIFYNIVNVFKNRKLFLGKITSGNFPIGRCLVKKRISALFPLIVMMFFFWLFPFQVKASEITTEGSSCISVNNRVEAMTTMTDTFQSLLPDGETEENFTATISGHLINSSLCEYYPLFRQVTEDNNWGNKRK